MKTADLHHVDVPGGRLAYVERGQGSPVVLLHGGALDHRMWDDQLGPLAAAGHRVVAVDARGHGWSSTRPCRSGTATTSPSCCAPWTWPRPPWSGCRWGPAPRWTPPWSTPSWSPPW